MRTRQMVWNLGSSNPMALRRESRWVGWTTTKPAAAQRSTSGS